MRCPLSTASLSDHSSVCAASVGPPRRSTRPCSSGARMRRHRSARRGATRSTSTPTATRASAATPTASAPRPVCAIETDAPATVGAPSDATTSGTDAASCPSAWASNVRAAVRPSAKARRRSGLPNASIRACSSGESRSASGRVTSATATWGGTSRPGGTAGIRAASENPGHGRRPFSVPRALCMPTVPILPVPSPASYVCSSAPPPRPVRATRFGRHARRAGRPSRQAVV